MGIAMIEALGWSTKSAAANIDVMKQARKIIGVAISVSGFFVLVGGLV